MPTFLSLFSGIGGIDLGLERAGWDCVGQVEIDPYRRGILERHWPGVPRWDDVRGLCVRDPESRLGSERGSVREDVPVQSLVDERADREHEPAGVDLICGGFPCQDLSVAGKRAGLEGARSSLWWEFHRIADAIHPRWVLVENVPGLLSSHKGRDFALLLTSLADLGYGFAWRILDSRYFGVPQRRRRVFIVGHLGAESPEPFLPFLESGEGNPSESGETGTDVAGTLGGGSGKRGWADDFDRSGAFVTGRALTQGQRWDGETETFVAHAPHRDPGGVSAPDTKDYVAYHENIDGKVYGSGEVPALRNWQKDSPMLVSSSVRRLTPVECCRLQGFPDDWLGEPNAPPDSPRYAALGDAVTVPVAEWIGRRLLKGRWLRQPLPS